MSKVYTFFLPLSKVLYFPKLRILLDCNSVYKPRDAYLASVL